MPKKTFYNLAPEKRKLINAAARAEFARVPLAEASIARIIKEAEIPRGSFYQYFEDKDDLFIEIAAEEAKKKFRVFINILTSQDGDLLRTLEIFFEIYIKHLGSEENKKLERNIFLSMDERMRNRMVPHRKEHPCREEFKEAMKKIDQKKLGLKSDKEFRYLCKMLSGILFRLFAQVLNDMTDKEEAWEIFQFEMDIIKRGIQARQTN